jgi:hypothetical protein
MTAVFGLTQLIGITSAYRPCSPNFVQSMQHRYTDRIERALAVIVFAVRRVDA